MGSVDGVMTVSAAQALFYNQTALILSGLPNTTQYVTYPPMPKAGAVSQVRCSTSSSSTVLACTPYWCPAQCGRVCRANVSPAKSWASCLPTNTVNLPQRLRFHALSQEELLS